MVWQQVYDPFGNMFISTALGAVPVVVMLAALGFFHIKAHIAAALGLLAAQMADASPESIEILYAGDVAKLNTKPLTCEIVAGVLNNALEGVNRVNAPSIAKERGIKITESTTDDAHPWATSVTVTLGRHSVTGSLFGQGNARIVAVDGIDLETPITPHMLLIRNQDKPGLIGAVGTALGKAGVNIGDFRLGRGPGGHAIALVSVDAPLTNATLDVLQTLPHMERVIRLAF